MVKLKLLLSFYFLLFSFCFFNKNVVAQNESVNSKAFFHVGVVLDLSSNIGEIAESCISIAVSDFYDVHANYTTRLVLHTMDSKNDVVAATSSALNLMKDVEVQAIIGPQESTQASFVIDLGEKAQVPIVSFSARSPSLSPLKSPYFIRTAINDSSQVKAIAGIIQAFEWKEVVMIYEDTDYGNGVIPYFMYAFQKIDIQVPYRSIIPLDATNEQILEELNTLKTMQIRVFIVHMSSSIGSRLFSIANNIAGMMSQGYAWIVTDGLSSLLAPMDSKAIDSVDGVLGVRPYVPKSKKLEEFKVRWKTRFYSSSSSKSYGTETSEPGLYGTWAYDTVWALTMAVEELGTLDPGFLSVNNTDNLTDISSLGYSPIGPRLLKNILSTSFEGLSGDFQLVNGQLESSTYEIFNVIREGERVIGYWSLTGGISRQLNEANSSSMSNLKAIVWPGESTTKPKGWDIYTNGKDSLKVLVPVKDGFKQFVSTEPDPITNKTTNITGFSIDVFHAIRSRLPFALSYHFVSYPLDGKPLDDYEKLIREVNDKDFDAAVGDISILADRATEADFTLPYTDSGVVMVVPMKDNLEKEFWMFVKPLNWRLWLITGVAFVWIGIVVWVLEHQNDELGIGYRDRILPSIWYSLSTLVFSQRERIKSNFTKLVLFIWVFYVLILTQSYTASLSSTLTTRQLQPTITDINDIIKNGYQVGYQDGSFVKEFLISHLKLEESKLKSYTTAEDYNDALSNGTVAAIFDEVPYIQVFLNTYCNQYKMVGRTYSSEGFGFVLPKGSPLTSYLSLAILNITDDGTLDTIKKRWLGEQTNCDSQDSIKTSELPLKNFGGLFVIVGSVSVLCFFIGVCLRLKEVINTSIFLGSSRQSMWDRISYIINALRVSFHVTQVVHTENRPMAEVECADIENTGAQTREEEEEHNIEPQDIVRRLSGRYSRMSFRSL